MTEGTGSASRRLGRRRRANASSGPRDRTFKVKVTDEEHALLTQLASQQNVTVQRLMIEAALSDAPETPTQRRQAMAELFGIRRLFAAVSNNINQIAKASNATGEFQVEATHTLRAVRNVVARIDEAIDGLSSR